MHTLTEVLIPWSFVITVDLLVVAFFVYVARDKKN